MEIVASKAQQREIELSEVVGRLLRSVREHLGLEVAFVSEIADGNRRFRFVDAADGALLVHVGDSDPAEQSFCANVLGGRLPQFMGDASQDPFARTLPVTAELPVGTHLSVPLRFSDGRVYGTFCCFSRSVRANLGPQDLRAMEMMAELAGEYIESVEKERCAWRRRREDIASILADPDALSIVFQPIVELDTMSITGVEALARFPGRDRGPDWFFAEADAVGLGEELELLAVQRALVALDQLPPHVSLNVNVSPNTLLCSAFDEITTSVDGRRLVVEVTEHAAIDDYTEVAAASARLRRRGIGLAVDDVGMGFSGFQRILESGPQKLKLDRVVVNDVDSNPIKQALIETFCEFGHRAGYDIVAEGIETPAELETLQRLHVKHGQGYFLGRPMALREVLRLLAARSPGR